QRTEERLNVAFEACSGAHWLAHQLIAIGHHVRLLTPESVRPFAKAQKNDWNDALVIAEAAQRPGRHAVGIKSQEQSDIQALHRVRQRLVTGRTAIVNQVRGLPRERGLVFGSGRLRFGRFLREHLTSQEIQLNPVCRALFATLATEYEAIDTRIEAIDAELAAFANFNSACRALMSVPGVGVIVATALFSAVANVSDFRSGRDLAAFLGLVPRQRSTGGKTTLLGISKRGNTNVRTLMLHGMRSAFYNRKKRENSITTFMERLVERGMHTNRIVVASANKSARIIWAILTQNTLFQPNAA
ncbi:MAG: IS110 family transposase, partial [Roseibium album]|uniref:IS110 family transposase n=1 Tax=Roseibium album TaxID=311410 RepID=UPI0032ED1B58